MPQMTPDEYERTTAIVTHATISRSIETAFPRSSAEDRDAMFVAVIDRLARMRGYVIRRWYDLDDACEAG